MKLKNKKIIEGFDNGGNVEKILTFIPQRLNLTAY